MNNKLNKSILLLIFCLSGYIPIYSQSAGQVQTQTINEGLESDLSSNSLPLVQLEDFYTLSTQKLEDFSNYLNLITDPNIDLALRQYTLKLAQDLFRTPKMTYQYYQDGKIQQITIEDYLNKVIQATSKITTKLEFITFNKTDFSSNIEKGSYHWTVQYLQKQEQNNQALPDTLITIKVHLKKIEKAFGSKTKTIWEVFLGEVIEIQVAP